MDCGTSCFPVHYQLPEVHQGPLNRWCHPISASCLQSFPASGSFLMSQFFTSGGQRIGASASASVLPLNIQDWFTLGLTGLISLQSRGLSRVFSKTTVRKHQLLRQVCLTPGKRQLCGPLLHLLALHPHPVFSPWLWLSVHKPRGCGFPIPAPVRSFQDLNLGLNHGSSKGPQEKMITLLLQRSTSECWTPGGWARPDVRSSDLHSFQLKCGAASNRRPDIKPWAFGLGALAPGPETTRELTPGIVHSENSHKGNHVSTRPGIKRPPVAPCAGCLIQTTNDKKHTQSSADQITTSLSPAHQRKHKKTQHKSHPVRSLQTTAPTLRGQKPKGRKNPTLKAGKGRPQTQ